jgi:uncharacterized protein YegP (UPF0339 family)/outer membrane protein OmpA-like peptidoglycan-associated protein
MSNEIQRRDDDYLPCDAYHHSITDEHGFHRFESEGKYYFSFIDHGIVALRSEGYSSEAGRENGIASVKKNMDNEDMYATKMLPNGKWVLSLKAGNHQEIARSCPEDSEEEAKSYLPSQRALFAAEFLRLASIEAGTVPQDGFAFATKSAANEADDYMICREYEEKYDAANIEEGGFIRFQHENTGKYYFAWVTADGQIVLRSEGYPTTGARDNGMESVRKNRDLEERYKIEESHGAYFLILKAGNHQEIGRSCPFKSEAEAKAFLPSERAKLEAQRLATIPTNTSTNEADDYMICREYEEKYEVANIEEGGFIRFQHENTGKYYFAWVTADGQIVLRSEGYPTTGARDNGMESVRKNRDLEERYKIDESHGAFFLILKAGNHQEIGRSCPFKSEAEARAFLPSERAKLEAMRLAAIPASDVNINEEDDYMICREYREKYDASLVDDQGFVKFQHENTGKYYFAWYNKDGDVILRSEGYPTASARDTGMESVIKNRDNKDRFKVEEKRGIKYLVLYAANHKEIARSCPQESESALWALLPLAAVPVVAVVEEPVVSAEIKTEETNEISVAAPLATAAAAAAVGTTVFEKSETKYKEPEKEDDYLACNEYKGFGVSDKANNIAFFKHKNGQFYFVVYHKDGSVRLRSEGFKTAQDRDQELRGVIKYLNDDTMYETIEKAGYVVHVLKDKTGREVGRSCPEKAGTIIAPIVPIAAAAATVAAAAATTTKKEEKPIAAAAAANPVVVDKPGFNWMWLLPLLLIPLFFLWKSCGDQTKEVSSNVVTETQPAVVETVKDEPKPVEAAPVAPSCDLNWILFDFDKYDITSEANTELQLMAKILKDNPTYKGVLKAFTDARGDDDYNQRLSTNRANAAKDVLVAAGVDVSRLSANAFSESAPIAKNTDDDSGRRFNRRVELYVQDANGIDVCKSIPPVVPAELKGN